MDCVTWKTSDAKMLIRMDIATNARMDFTRIMENATISMPMLSKIHEMTETPFEKIKNTQIN